MRFGAILHPVPGKRKGLWPLVAMCRGLKSVFPGSLFLGSANLLFGLEPVVEFRAGLIALEDVQLVGSPPDSLFKRQRLDRRFFRACGFWHGGIYLRRLRYHSFLFGRNRR